jgi:hypothetical protein
MIPIICTGASVLGAVCVTAGHAGGANAVWSISNIGLIWHNVRKGEFYQALMFGVFWILAVIGVVREVLL